jgi:hypothetical protein
MLPLGSLRKRATDVILIVVAYPPAVRCLSKVQLHGSFYDAGFSLGFCPTKVVRPLVLLERAK